MCVILHKQYTARKLMCNLCHLVSVVQSLNSTERTPQVSWSDLPQCSSQDDRLLLCEHWVTISQLVVTHTFLPSACISSSRGLQGLTDRQTDRDDIKLVWLRTSWTCSISYLSVTLWNWHYTIPVIGQLMTWKAHCIFGVFYLITMHAKR